MGTTYSVKIHTDKEIDIDQLKKLVDKKLVDFNQALSTYISDSEISLVNRAAAGRWVQISPLMLKNLDLARELYKKTGGLYDVSITPLVERWRFGAKKFDDWKMPTQSEIDEIKKCVGLNRFEFRGSQVKKSSSECQSLDFSSLAKGQGVDLIADFIKESGYEDAMIEIGGEVKILGDKNGKPWKIGVESPKLGQKIASVLEMKDGECVATSGGYRNFFVIEGKNYSHTINPLTGYPVDHRTASATVITDSCIKADAWATAFMVLGHEKSLELAKKEGIWTRLMVEKNSELEVFSTGAR